jgi:hypothetical protein
MVRPSHEYPAWRVFGAMLGAFALGVQLLLSAWLIGQAAAAAADQPDFASICSHDPAATTDETGVPAAPHQHGSCAACGCPLATHLVAPPPASASHVLPLPRSERLHAIAAAPAAEQRFHSPYASRAPPFSA